MEGEDLVCGDGGIEGVGRRCGEALDVFHTAVGGAPDQGHTGVGIGHTLGRNDHLLPGAGDIDHAAAALLGGGPLQTGGDLICGAAAMGQIDDLAPVSVAAQEFVPLRMALLAEIHQPVGLQDQRTGDVVGNGAAPELDAGDVALGVQQPQQVADDGLVGLFVVPPGSIFRKNAQQLPQRQDLTGDIDAPGLEQALQLSQPTGVTGVIQPLRLQADAVADLVQSAAQAVEGDPVGGVVRLGIGLDIIQPGGDPVEAAGNGALGKDLAEAEAQKAQLAAALKPLFS